MPPKTPLAPLPASQLKIAAGGALFADTDSAISQTNGPPVGLPGSQPDLSPFLPTKPAGVLEGDSILEKFQRASSCCANPDVPDDGKQANEAAEDCTPHFISPSPIPCLGHPAVRPDVPPEGSWLYHREAARPWM